jgi:hypothetical protein
MIVRDHLWDLLEQIKIGLSNHLSGQVGPINSLLQSLTRIFLKFGQIIWDENTFNKDEL